MPTSLSLSKRLDRGPVILAGSSAASGLGMLWWLAASMPGFDTLAIGVVMLAAFGYHTFRAVCTLNNELRVIDDRADVQVAN